MKNARPININPLSIHLPVSAWVSIGHRISGVLVFLLVPLLLIGLDISLSSREGFNHLREFSDEMGMTWLFWILFVSLLFHFLAGIRHLLMDIHIGESKSVSHITAYAVIALFIVLAFAFFLVNLMEMGGGA
jgi:succinate dehydrogenase / fumarate reductase cytochrome b subunit